MRSLLAHQESYRAFGGINDHENDEDISPHDSPHNDDDEQPHPSTHDQLLRSISENIIGENVELPGPYGSRPCVYADWTASGRLLQQVC
jgi:hypothetical protein